MLALTIEQARSLVARISGVIEERDRLLREVEGLRLIMSELAALRDLLENDVSGAVVARAMNNGCLAAHVSNDIRELENAGELSVHTTDLDAVSVRHHPNASEGVSGADEADATEIPGVHTTEIDAGDGHRERTADNDVSRVAHADNSAPETDADMSAAAVDVDGRCAASSFSPTAPEPETLSAGSEQDDHHAELAANVLQIEKAPGRPPEGTLMWRILTLIEASDRPRRPWQIQKELRLPRMPSAELSRLVSAGCLERVKEGVYGIPGRRYDRLSIEGF